MTVNKKEAERISERIGRGVAFMKNSIYLLPGYVQSCFRLHRHHLQYLFTDECHNKLPS